MDATSFPVMLLVYNFESSPNRAISMGRFARIAAETIARSPSFVCWYARARTLSAKSFAAAMHSCSSALAGTTRSKNPHFAAASCERISPSEVKRVNIVFGTRCLHASVSPTNRVTTKLAHPRPGRAILLVKINHLSLTHSLTHSFCVRAYQLCTNRFCSDYVSYHYSMFTAQYHRFALPS